MDQRGPPAIAEAETQQGERRGCDVTFRLVSSSALPVGILGCPRGFFHQKSLDSRSKNHQFQPPKKQQQTWKSKNHTFAPNKKTES